jgi:hypothetical protein
MQQQTYLKYVLPLLNSVTQKRAACGAAAFALIVPVSCGSWLLDYPTYKLFDSIQTV